MTLDEVVALSGYPRPIRQLIVTNDFAASAKQLVGRLLVIERAGRGCAAGSVLFERIHQP
ncbi:MAG: hypothetical protein ACLPUG_12980 [Acidimicrobiales bacterium]